MWNKPVILDSSILMSNISPIAERQTDHFDSLFLFCSLPELFDMNLGTKTVGAT